MRRHCNHLASAALIGLLGESAQVSAQAPPPSPEYLFFPVTGPGGGFTSMQAVNDLGVAIGYTFSQGFFFNDGIVTQLGTVTNDVHETSSAYDINNLGVVAARSSRFNPATQQLEPSRPYLVSNGTWTQLFNCGGDARAVNLAGQATGTVAANNCANDRAYFYDGSTLNTLPPLGGPSSYGLGINAAGTVVGQSLIDNIHPVACFALANGSLQALPGLGGFDSIAQDINDAGVIVGDSQPSGSDIRAVKWVNGTLVNLHQSGSYSEALSINSLGVIVGEVGNRATIWRNGAQIDLNTLIAPGSGYVLTVANDISNTGWIVGQCTIGGQTRGFVLKPIDVDTDGDGLMDDWETNGIPYVDSTGAAQRFLLNVDGACDPQHKDLFVEVDAMSAAGLAPTAADLLSVKAAFNNAPAALVNNPDGLPGVKLHILIDETNLPTMDFPNKWTEFNQLKLTASSGTTLAGYFGTVAERTGPDSTIVRNTKRKAFRYCIFGKTHSGGGSSGSSELPGNDFMVTLGSWPTTGGTSSEKAGTFMHELGHTLGLGHGGSDPATGPDHTLYKPNYYSIMNYTWQTPEPWMPPGAWPLSIGRVGFSKQALLDLDEAQLFECQGVGAPAGTFNGIKVLHNTNAGATPQVLASFMCCAMDWNNDNNVDCFPTTVAVDLNHLIPTDAATPGEILRGREDWSQLIYNFRDSPDFADGVQSTGNLAVEITLAQQQALAALPAFCAGDINGDRQTNVADLLAVITSWGICPNGCIADIAPVGAPDGQVNVADLLAVITAWGPCP